MQFLEYPYVIITILALSAIIMGCIGLFFTLKSAKTVSNSHYKGFCSIGKIENRYAKSVRSRENNCLLYISVSLDGMKRIYPESRAMRMFEDMRNTLFKHFAIKADGDISIYDEDDFVAVNNLKEEEMANCINECFSELNEVFINHSAVNVVHFNFGFVCTGSNEVAFKTALSRAKQACSIAEDKQLLFCSWDNLNGKQFERKIKIENNIENEIDNNRFHLEYQPIIEAETNNVVGAEVLSRLNSESEGVLPPKTFLEAVNNVGLNGKFDYYIFDKNSKWISNDKQSRAKCFYTINFSRQTFCDEALAENIIQIIKKYGIDFSTVAVEILEDKTLNENEKSIMIKNLSILKKEGILILLDDFGKGYTSFVDLAEFDIDIVKIDKSITQNSNTNTGFIILKNIIKTAHDLGFKTLCEGIETEEQKKAVEDAGCDFLQGYYFYRPMSVAQFEKILDKH